MAQLALYRKYRSQTFSDLMGQAHVVRTLQNALKAGKFSHAYLFTGPRGTGKTSTARLLAKALCCEKGPAAEPCNECAICRSITQGNCMDVIEMDAASESGVDEVRDVIVRVSEYAPAECRFKVFIIDEVHDLSGKAFDALLKTIEEPPPHLVFVLATTEFSKVPTTIRSRCQKHEFRRATIHDLVQRLEFVCEQEGVKAEPAALAAIARMADGAFRDALNLLEQAVVTVEGELTAQHVFDQLGLIDDQAVDELLAAMRAGNSNQIVALLSEWTQRGRDPRSILESMLLRLSELTRAAVGVDAAASEDATRSAALHESAARLGMESILKLRSALSEAHRLIRDITLPGIWLESELIRIATAKVEPAEASSAPEVAPSQAARKLAARGSEAPAEPVKAPQAESQAKSEPQQTESDRVTSEAEPVATDALEESLPEDLKSARAVWRKVVETIDKAGKNPAITRKLKGTQAIAFENGTLTVEFERQIDFDGITLGPNGPGRVHKLLSLVREESGQPWDVKYVVAKRTANGAPQTAAVELQLEGQKLLDATREVFQGG